MTQQVSRRLFIAGASFTGLASTSTYSEASSRSGRISVPFHLNPRRKLAPFGSSVSSAIVHYNRASPNVGTAGLLLEDGLEEAVALGFKTIIDMRGGDENGVAEESGKAKRLGIPRFHLPITTKMIDQDLITRFASIVEDLDQHPVLAHCVSANRVSGMWALYRARCGVDPIVALEEARACGLTSREPAIREMLKLPPA
mgnify:CR=1 FL=1